MEQSVFRGALEFLFDLGVYDVILPFLLVFTIMYAILEKTKILGTEEARVVGESDSDRTVSRKNLNAMVSFVTSFFVVASTQLVGMIHQFVANVALVLIIIVMFMLLVGSFHEEKEKPFFLEGGWRSSFIWITFIIIILITLSSLGWLTPAWNYMISYWDTRMVSTIILLILVVGAMMFVVKEPKKEKEED